MRRDRESRWVTERVENALLRERINDVVAEVARLTAALEGPNLPFESITAIGTSGVGKPPSTNGGGPEAGATMNPRSRTSIR